MGQNMAVCQNSAGNYSSQAENERGENDHGITGYGRVLRVKLMIPSLVFAFGSCSSELDMKVLALKKNQPKIRYHLHPPPFRSRRGMRADWPGFVAQLCVFLISAG